MSTATQHALDAETEDTVLSGASTDDRGVWESWKPRLIRDFDKRRTMLWLPIHMDLVRKRGYRVETAIDRVENFTFPRDVDQVEDRDLGKLSFRYESYREHLSERIIELRVYVQTADELLQILEADVTRILRARKTAVSGLAAEVKHHPAVILANLMFRVWKVELRSLEEAAAQMDRNIAALSREISRRRYVFDRESRLTPSG